MASIELSRIQKRFGTAEVLKDVTLSIADREFVTLVGPSGCGKSTLLRILAGLEAADGGTVQIAGQDMTRVRPAHRNLAMVFQSYALYPHLTIAQNMATPLKLRDLSRWARLPVIGPLSARSAYRAIGEQVRETARTLQIEALLDRKPSQLSGGQRQRAALGRAMVRQPVAFLMDEPLSNLDAALRVHMRAELSELHRRLGATFVYVTHDQAEALTMSDKMAVMMGGRILQFGPPDQVFANPATLDVAEFVGSPKINILPGEVDHDGRVSALGRGIPARLLVDGRLAKVGLRPEQLHLDGGADGWLGRVVHRENLGHDLYFHVALDADDQRLVVRGAQDRNGAESLGDAVRVGFKPDRALFFAPDGTRLHSVVPAKLAESA